MKKNNFEVNWIQRLFFFWMDPLLWKGFWRKIDDSDLHECAREVESMRLYAHFERTWSGELNKVQNGKKPSILLALAKATYSNLIMCVIFMTLQSLTLPAIGLFYLYFTETCNSNNKLHLLKSNVTTMDKNEERDIITSLGWAMALSISVMLSVILNSIGRTYTSIQGMQLRIICIAAICKKILRLQQTTINKISTGHLINIISNDVQRFELVTEFGNSINIAVIQLPVIITMILVYVGPIGLIGFFIVLLHLPIEATLTKIFGHFKKNFYKATDERTRMMDQIIRGIRVIKMYGWEKAFVEHITKLRAAEVKHARLSGLIHSNSLSFYGTSMFEGLFVTYLISFAIGNPLSPNIAGFYLLLLNIARIFLVFHFGQFLFLGKAIVLSCKRIQNILELSENIQTCIEYKPLVSKPKVCFSNFSASWNERDKWSKEDLVLVNLNLEILGSTLSVITGRVGSGKSSLLLSIVNELAGLKGKLEVTGSISYAPQEAWIFSGTIRDNILLGSHFKNERYSKVLEITCLNKDLKSLEDGDLSLIGERGMTLSGGQKARISLARALYREADIYLLDDPLSAVDATVGRYIFNKAIRGFLKGKLVILVTHSTHFAIKSDFIFEMEKGTIALQSEKWSCINEVSHVFKKYCQEPEIINRQIRNASDVIVDNIDLDSSIINERTPLRAIKIDYQTMSKKETLSQTATREDIQSGSVSFYIYLKYFTIGGYIWPIMLIIVTIISNGGNLSSLWYAQEWSRCYYCASTLVNNSKILHSNSSECDGCYGFTSVNNTLFYSILTASGILCTFLQGWLIYFITLRASRILHDKMIRNIIHAPVRFFDVNPSGRILNRFTKDIGFMDEQIPLHFHQFIQDITYIFGTLIAVCFIQVALIIPIILFLAMLLAIRYYFLKASRQIKRYESNARSPIYSQISSTIQGLRTIRAFHIQERVSDDYFYLQNNHSRCLFDFKMGIRWLGVRIDFLSSVLVTFAIFSAFVAKCIINYNELIEYSLSVLLFVPDTLQYAIKLSCDIEIFMVSAERIIEYINIIREERLEPREGYIENISLHKNGSIHFKNVSFRYAVELPYSLHNVTFSINPGEKIGISGRTGAGKSSLFNVLFRLNEIHQGSITINGIDISTLPLQTLRKSISIIPQDAFLFSGTLRYNLDPFAEYSDNEIWLALEETYLAEMVRRLDDQLLVTVNEDGQNFSAGQRQLICLARALLRKNKIIVIDEATANIDRKTDALLQRAIREHFTQCTVLTIAHRLETILDYDRILVMDARRVAEFDTPSNLLANPNSLLSIRLYN